jgi:hypothetical protein
MSDKANSGFTFNQIDRGTARYESGGRSIDIEVEAGVNGLLIVYLSAAKAWREPVAPLSEAEREEIARNLRSIDMGPFARLDVC